MKQFFEEYGGVTLGVLALIILIVMVSPLRSTIDFSLKNTVKTATQKASNQSKMVGKKAVGNANPNHIAYSINYNTNGGNNIASIESWRLPDTLPVPVKSGYKFLGWWKDNVFTEKSIPSEAIGAPTTLYAKWQILNYPISYNVGGGTMSGEKTEYTVETNDFTLPTPTKTGYTFLGWTGSNGSTPQTTVSIPKGSVGNKSYTANWGSAGFTITFNGPFLSSSSYTHDEGSTLTFNEIVPYSNNGSGKIGSWFYDEGLTQRVTLSDTLPDSNLTLYPLWLYKDDRETMGNNLYGYGAWTSRAVETYGLICYYSEYSIVNAGSETWNGSSYCYNKFNPIGNSNSSDLCKNNTYIYDNVQMNCSGSGSSRTCNCTQRKYSCRRLQQQEQINRTFDQKPSISDCDTYGNYGYSHGYTSANYYVSRTDYYYKCWKPCDSASCSWLNI